MDEPITIGLLGPGDIEVSWPGYRRQLLDLIEWDEQGWNVTEIHWPDCTAGSHDVHALGIFYGDTLVRSLPVPHSTASMCATPCVCAFGLQCST